MPFHFLLDATFMDVASCQQQMQEALQYSGKKKNINSNPALPNLIVELI